VRLRDLAEGSCVVSREVVVASWLLLPKIANCGDWAYAEEQTGSV
jgi:hypothetical protein